MGVVLVVFIVTVYGPWASTQLQGAGSALRKTGDLSSDWVLASLAIVAVVAALAVAGTLVGWDRVLRFFLKTQRTSL